MPTDSAFRKPLWWQWLPTSLGSSMLVLEIPVVAAAVVRSGSGTRGLAALGIGVAVIVVANGPALALAPLVVTLDGRVARRSLRTYTAVVGLVAAVLVAVLGLCRPVLAGLLDLDPATARDAAAVLLVLAPASIVVALRRYQHGRLIAIGATAGIGVATAVRLAASAAFAWAVVPFTASGAVLGGAALTLGACAEATVLAVALRRSRAAAGERRAQRAADPVPPAGLRAIGATHLPMAATRVLNMIPQLIMVVGIAHAPHSLASLATWPVVYGLLSLFTGPLADFETVGTAALRSDPLDPEPRRLARVLVVVVTVLYGAVLLSPLLRLYLSGFSQLSGEPLDLGLTWAVCTLLVPAGWVVRGYLRATVLAGGRYGSLGYGVGVHLAGLMVFLAITIGAGLPGVACAGLAVFGGVFVEIGSLAIAARRGRITGGDRSEPAVNRV